MQKDFKDSGRANNNAFYAIAIKVFIYLILYAASIISMQSVFNIIPFTTQYDFLFIFDTVNINSIIKYVTPLLSALIYFVIYTVMESFTCKRLQYTLTFFIKDFDVNRAKIFLGLSLIILIVLKLLQSLLFMYFPYISAIAKPLFSLFNFAIVATFAMFTISGNKDKSILAITNVQLIFPLVLLCLFA